MASTNRGDASAASTWAPPGVVDQHIEPAEVLDRLGDDPLGVRRLADVGGDEHRPRDLGLVAPARHDMGPGRGERRHDARPDPAGAARHHHDTLAEVVGRAGPRGRPYAGTRPYDRGDAALARPGSLA
jgi:hypothetical protein